MVGGAWAWHAQHLPISTTIIMGFLSATQKNIILSILDVGQSAHSIASTTGVNASTVSRLHFKDHSKLQKSTGDCLSNLSPINCYVVCVIKSLAAHTQVWMRD